MLFLKRSTLYFLLCGTLIMTAVMVKTGAPLKTAATPAGIINLEFAHNSAKVNTVLTAWKKASTETIDVIAAAKFNTALDFFYLLFYSFFLFACCKQLAVLLTRQKVLAQWLNRFAVAALVAGFLDVVENFGMLQALVGKSTDAVAMFTTAVSLLKWLLVILVMLLIIAGLFVKTTMNRKLVA